MKYETYLEIMRTVLDMGPDVTREEMEAKAIRRMEDAGYTVRLDRMTDHRFRVRVQRKEGRRMVFNYHTASTSGYPILAAYEKWEPARKEGTAA